MTEEKNKNYETILLERLEGKIDAIIEDQNIIKEKVEKIDLLVDDMDYVKSTLTENKDRFKEIDNISADHEKRLITLEKMSLAKA